MIEHLGKGDGLRNWNLVDLDGVLGHLDVSDGDELEERRDAVLQGPELPRRACDADEGHDVGVSPSLRGILAEDVVRLELQVLILEQLADVDLELFFVGVEESLPPGGDNECRLDVEQSLFDSLSARPSGVGRFSGLHCASFLSGTVSSLYYRIFCVY